MRSAIAWEQYQTVREQLQKRIGDKIRKQMASLVGNLESADLLLVAADGKKLPAHECILRARAPGFYQRHVDATVAAMGPRQEGKMREVAIGDIDSAGLEFFIHSVYTEDEIAQLPTEGEELDDRRAASQASNVSFNMEESAELDFPHGGVDDCGMLPEETPTQGRPPLQQFLASVNSTQSSPRRQMISSTCSSIMTNSGSNFPMSSSLTSSVPVMTSFRDLASGSPMNGSAYSIRSEVADIPEEDEDSSAHERRSTRPQDVSMSKFIRLDSLDTTPTDQMKEYLHRKRSSGGPKQIFPMFIGLSDDQYTHVDRQGSTETLRSSSGRMMMSKRLSMTSLTSLTSIDMTPSEGQTGPICDKAPASKLASDLLQMYINNEDTDVVIKTENGDLHAHRCILSATCPFFRQQLVKSKKIEMKGFSKNSVHFLLSFLYGGLTTIPEEVDIWEIIALAAHLNHKDLTDVVILHLKATKCHWFHRPCAGCVSAVFDALPQMSSIRCLNGLYDEALAWQAKHFSRIWKGRVFIHLGERWQKECYEAVIQHMDDETLIDTILGCERLQVSLPRSKAEGSLTVLTMVDDILDVAMQFLVHSFHLLVTSKSFQQQGKGLALNLGILEDLLPSAIHSLTADVAIKTFKGLGELLLDIQSKPPSQKRALSIPIDEYSQRFVSLVRRMYEIVDKHLLHYAASVVKAEAWGLLNEQEQQRIQETGLFVELRQPKAPPPRLSSYNRSYKRSASVGVQFTQNNGNRSMSSERGRPLSTIQQSNVPVTEPEGKQQQKPEVIEQQQQQPPVQDSPRRSRKDDVISPQPPAKKPQPKTSKLVKPSPTRTASLEDKKTSGERPGSRVDKKMEEDKTTKETTTTSTTTTTTTTDKPRTSSPRTKTPSTDRVTKKSPAKKKIQDTEENRLERQTTHTIMNIDRTRLANLPGPEQSPSKSSEKPKSVVKPMVKEPPLASSATSRPISRTVNRDRTKDSTTPTKPVSARSSIPKSVVRNTVAKDMKPRPSSGPSRVSQRSKNLNSIEK